MVVWQKRIQDIEKKHFELLDIVADGSKTDMDAWNGTEIFKFYYALWVQQERIARINEQIEAEKKKNG